MNGIITNMLTPISHLAEYKITNFIETHSSAYCEVLTELSGHV